MNQDLAGRGGTSKLNDVLSGLSELIRSQQIAGAEHEPTATEYFVVILKTLSAGGKMDAFLESLLRILAAVTPQAVKSVVREQFRPLSTTLMRILSVSSDNPKPLKLALSCLGELLKQQEMSEGFWGSLPALKAVNVFLSLIDDARTNVRKLVHEELKSILQIQFHSRGGAFGSYLAQFSIEVLRGCTRSEYKRSLYVVLFLETTIGWLPVDLAVKLIDALLQLQECGQPVLTAAVFRTLDSFFQNPYSQFSDDQLQSASRRLLLQPPSTQDMEANTYYCTALASVLLRLHKQNAAMCLALLPAAVQVLVQASEAEFTQIQCAVATALKRLISGIVDDAMVLQAHRFRERNHGNSDGSLTEAASTLLKVISELELLLQLRYQHTWPYTLDVVRCLFEWIRGESSRVLLTVFMRKTVEVYEMFLAGTIEVSPPVEVALTDTIGAMLRSCGVSIFLSVVPWLLPTSPFYVGIDSIREWLLVIFHNNLGLMPCWLRDFNEHVLVPARACNQAVQDPSTHNLDASQVSILRNRVLQLWSLFPDFCAYRVQDISDGFPRIVKILEGAMKDASYPEIMPDVVSGLTNLVRKVKEKYPGLVIPVDLTTLPPDLGVLSSHARTFLPILLTLLETIDISDIRFQGLTQGVAAWASVSPPNLITSVAKKLLQLLLVNTQSTASMTEGSNEVAIAGWMALMQCVIPYLPFAMVNLLYKTIRPMLSVNESVSLQKRAYGVLDGLLRTHGNAVYQNESALEILSLISDSLLSCHVSARSMRLRCMQTLLENMSESELLSSSQSVLGEVLICQKDANKKSRDAAMAVLRILVEKLPSDAMLFQLCSALAGETTTMRASSLIGMCVLLLNKRGETELMTATAELLPTVCLLLREGCVEQTRAVLSFLRVCAAVLPVPSLETLLPILVPGFTTEVGALKPKFSSRIRAIMRKLSQRVRESLLTPLVAEEDRGLLHYVLKQERRSRRNKQKSKDLKAHDVVSKMLGSDSEDSDGEEDEVAAHPVQRGVVGDRRVVNRPVATRASEVHSGLPRTLDDLLEDQPGGLMQSRNVVDNAAGKSRKSKRGAENLLPTDDSEPPSEKPEEEEDGYNVVVSRDGRVVIEEKPEKTESGMPEIERGTKNGGRRTGGVDEEGDEEEHRRQATQQPEANKKQRVKAPGEEYRSKKAGGDVWRKGMLEPHAFVSLDPRLLSKKHERTTLNTLSGLLRSSAGKQKTAVTTSSGNKTRVSSGNRKQRRVAREHVAHSR